MPTISKQSWGSVRFQVKKNNNKKIILMYCGDVLSKILCSELQRYLFNILGHHHHHHYHDHHHH